MEDALIHRREGWDATATMAGKQEPLPFMAPWGRLSLRLHTGEDGEK